MLIKSFLILLMTITVIPLKTTENEMRCTEQPIKMPSDWVDIPEECSKAMGDHIQIEIASSIQYLAMAAFFSRDIVNRPGFAKFFFKMANEEREHAGMLLKYLLMRGKLCENISNLVEYSVPPKTVWGSGLEALADGLKLEVAITKRIRKIITKCEQNADNIDTNAAHYLITNFLEEQAKSQRDLAGMISTLGKMMRNSPQLAEFMYDKTLLHPKKK